MRASAALPLVALAACVSPAERDFGVPKGYRRVYWEDFAQKGVMGAFAFSDPKAWAWHFDPTSVETDVLHCSWVELEGASAYQPPHRSPHSLALIPGPQVGDFVFQLDALQTGREYGHRDLVLIFGFRDPGHYYYVHLATAPDDNAHNVFVVDGADRRRVAAVPASGIDWGERVWHLIRIERTLADGAIRVYFDDLQTPVIEATDATHGWGRLGFGSFDDTGRFTNVLVWAPESRATGDGSAFGNVIAKAPPRPDARDSDGAGLFVDDDCR